MHFFSIYLEIWCFNSTNLIHPAPTIHLHIHLTSTILTLILMFSHACNIFQFFQISAKVKLQGHFSLSSGHNLVFSTSPIRIVLLYKFDTLLALPLRCSHSNAGNCTSSLHCERAMRKNHLVPKNHLVLKNHLVFHGLALHQFTIFWCRNLIHPRTGCNLDGIKSAAFFGQSNIANEVCKNQVKNHLVPKNHLVEKWKIEWMDLHKFSFVFHQRHSSVLPSTLSVRCTTQNCTKLVSNIFDFFKFLLR